MGKAKTKQLKVEEPPPSFKVGARVRLVKAMPEWGHWIPGMSNLLGHEGVISFRSTLEFANFGPPVWGIRFSDLAIYSYPQECLELV